MFILEDAAIKRTNGRIYGNSELFFSLYTTLMKGDSLYNIDIIKLSPDSTQGFHSGCIIRCHVSCLVLCDGNLLYFVFERQTEMLWEDSVLVGLDKLTATFAQRQNLKNFIKFLK